MKVKAEEITILDPLYSSTLSNNFSHAKSTAVAKDIFQRKLNILKANAVLTQSHCLRKDIFNCGVYVCYYALQLGEGKVYNVCQ